MIPLIEAYKILDSVTARRHHHAFKTIKTLEALDRVLAEDQVSQVNLPAFDKATMDGYAILENDKHSQYVVLETVPAGKVPKMDLRPGCVIKVMTGAPVPHGTSKVIPVEYAQEKSGLVVFSENYPDKRNIAKLGEDMRVGDVAVEKGTLITPIILANLIACGISEVAVYRRFRVAIISTGDEIVSNVADISPGKIMNSNGPMLEALCHKFGFKVVANVIVKDDLKHTKKIISDLEKEKHLDIILLSGGVSVGDFDFVEQALKDAKYDLHFNSVAIKPGRPVTFASKDNILVFALPGNPLAVYLTFYLFVLRAYWRRFEIEVAHNTCTFSLKEDFVRRDVERMEFVPCYIDETNGIVPILTHGSAHLAALIKSQGFFVVPKGEAQLKKGTLVQCYLFGF